MLLKQIEEKRCEIENQYTRIVPEAGNSPALKAVARVYELREFFEWRGLGSIDHSGVRMRTEYECFDAERKFAIPNVKIADPKSCQCGEVLKGVIKPWQCKVCMNVVPLIRPRPRGKLHVPTVTLAHGGGGKAMKDLIDDVFIEAFDNPLIAPLEDQARINLTELTNRGDRLAFTTDSFVVDPLIFPGGDIGKLAVCGTVNDLAVGGAVPLYLSCAVIIEEGVPI
jgi:hypothetical protein